MIIIFFLCLALAVYYKLHNEDTCVTQYLIMSNIILMVILYKMK